MQFVGLNMKGVIEMSEKSPYFQRISLICLNTNEAHDYKKNKKCMYAYNTYMQLYNTIQCEVSLV